MKSIKGIFACSLALCLLGEGLSIHADASSWLPFLPTGMQDYIDSHGVLFDDHGLLANGKHEIYLTQVNSRTDPQWGVNITYYYTDTAYADLHLTLNLQDIPDALEVCSARISELAAPYLHSEAVTFAEEQNGNAVSYEAHLSVSETDAQKLTALLKEENLILRAAYSASVGSIQIEPFVYYSSLSRIAPNNTQMGIKLHRLGIQEFLTEHYPLFRANVHEDGKTISLWDPEDVFVSLEDTCAVVMDVCAVCDCTPCPEGGWQNGVAYCCPDLGPETREYVLYALDAMLGDLDYNGTLGVADAVLMARAVAEDATLLMSEQAYQNADYNEDGLVDAGDLTTLLGTIAGLNQSA